MLQNNTGNPVCTCCRCCGRSYTSLWVAPCTACTQDTSVPSTELRREREANLPYLEHKCHMFRHVFNTILTSSMVITKCSTSVTSWPYGIVWVSAGRARWQCRHRCYFLTNQVRYVTGTKINVVPIFPILFPTFFYEIN